MKTKKIPVFINYCLLLLLAALLFSCSSDGFQEKIVGVDVDVEDVARALVINGKIEEDSSAVVQISYSEDIDASIAPIHYEENATVILSSGNGSLI